MNTPKLRMVAGPNGSGKSTIVDYLRSKYSFPLGFILNPDDVERQLIVTKKLDFAVWGLRVKGSELRAFIQTHALGATLEHVGVSVRNNVLRLGPNFHQGYFTAVTSLLIVAFSPSGFCLSRILPKHEPLYNATRAYCPQIILLRDL